MLAIESLEAASGKMREGISPKIAKNAAKLFAMVSAIIALIRYRKKDTVDKAEKLC